MSQNRSIVHSTLECLLYRHSTEQRIVFAYLMRIIEYRHLQCYLQLFAFVDDFFL